MNLGGLQSSKDFRDIQLARVQVPITIPENYSPDLSIYPRYFQGQQPACTCHAGVMLKIIQQTQEFNTKQDFSPRFLWTEVKKIDGLPISDGSSMRWVLKVLQNTGVCDFNLAGNNVNLTEYDYSNLEVTNEMLDNAQPRIINSYAFPGTDEVSLKQAIYQNKAVLLRIVVDEGFFGKIFPEFTTPKWGHLVCAVGYDKDNIVIIDSTEEDFSISVKYINRKYWGFITEAGTAVDLPDQVIKDQISRLALLQKLVALYQLLVKLIKGR